MRGKGGGDENRLSDATAEGDAKKEGGRDADADGWRSLAVSLALPFRKQSRTLYKSRWKGARDTGRRREGGYSEA